MSPPQREPSSRAIKPCTAPGFRSLGQTPGVDRECLSLGRGQSPLLSSAPTLNRIVNLLWV